MESMVKHQIAVEIDHSRLVTVVPVERGSRGEMDLTTIAPNQRRAVIRLFVVSNASSQLLSTIDIENVPQFGRPRPTLHLKSRIWRRRLTVSVVINGKVVTRRHEDLSPYLPAGRGAWAIAATALLLIMVAAGGFLAIRTLSAPVNGPEVATDRVTPTARTPQVQPEMAVASLPARRRVFFLPDSAELTPDAREELLRTAEWLGGLREKQILVRIEGHCAPAGSELGRLELSRQRARAVEQFLREAGWRPTVPAVVAGFSSERPTTTDPAQQHLNRRAEVIVEPRG